MNTQSNDIPGNPVIALTNLPQPQVISGTLGESGAPLAATHAGILPNVIDSNSLALVDCIGMFSVKTSDEPGKRVVGIGLPYADAPFTGDTYPNRPCNWNNVLMRSHEYWDCTQDLSFTFVGPAPIVGKLLITYDPAALSIPADFSTVYRFDRRKLTVEWDLAATKVATISIQGFKIDHKRPTCLGTIQGIKTAELTGPKISLHGHSTSIGAISINVIQRLQAMSLYPSSFTVLVTTSFGKSVMYTPTDIRNKDGNNGYVVTANNVFNSTSLISPQ